MHSQNLFAHPTSQELWETSKPEASPFQAWPSEFSWSPAFRVESVQANLSAVALKAACRIRKEELQIVQRPMRSPLRYRLSAPSVQKAPFLAIHIYMCPCLNDPFKAEQTQTTVVCNQEPIKAALRPASLLCLRRNPKGRPASWGRSEPPLQTKTKHPQQAIGATQPQTVLDKGLSLKNLLPRKPNRRP